jgi:hypothetical protein
MANGGNAEANGAHERSELEHRVGMRMPLRRQDIGQSEERVPRCQGDPSYAPPNRPVSS